MSLTNSPIWMSATAAGFYDYEINNSLRFNDDDSAYLSRTPASDGNLDNWTFSAWTKLTSANPATGRYLIGASIATSKWFHIAVNTSGQIDIRQFNSSSYDFRKITVPVLRDVSAWYHIVVSYDSDDATAEDRIKVYVNGERITSFGTNENPSSGKDSYLNQNHAHTIGAFVNDNGSSVFNFYDGYLAEVNLVDGTTLLPTSFGETKTGIWIPKAYSGSYGTNGFHLDFGNSGALGTDVSANGNDFTANNLAATDQMPDTPTNNYPTINGIQSHGSILSDGNLTMDNNNRVVPMLATMGVSSGKWAWKVTINTQDAWGIGISTTPRTDNNSGGLGFVSYEYSYDTWDGDKRNNNTQSAYGVSVSSGGNVEVLLDLDAGTLSFKANGSDQGTAYSGLSGTFFPAFANWAASTGAGDTIDVDFGQGGYTAPSGYELLNAANLPDPAIDPAQDSSPEDYFGTLLFTGDGTSGRTIATGETGVTGNVNFTPDWVWIKSRSDATNHLLTDVLRGGTAQLRSNLGDAEVQFGNVDLTFTDGGFTNAGSSSNESGRTFVAWNWKAGGSGSSNTDGSITSTVSANQTSGFSIVTYSGNGTAGATIGHGLGKAPDMIILKRRNETRNWQVYHSGNTSAPETEKLTLNLTDATVDDNTSWNDTAPSSSVFTVGTSNGTNNSSGTYVAYCFADIDGMVKTGSYIGNSSTTFVYTGFRPAFVMIKSNNQTRNWIVFDNKRTPTNQMDGHLHPNASIAEQTGSDEIDFLSNGFNLRSPDNDTNTSAFEYVYLAFAEQPFKYANAK